MVLTNQIEEQGIRKVKFVVEMTVYPNGMIYPNKMYPIGEQRVINKPKQSKKKEVEEEVVMKNVEEL